MLNIDFLIFYEVANRELENIILLKLELESRGYSVKIVHFIRSGYFSAVRHWTPKVILVPWLRYDDNIYIYTRLKTPTNRIINLQWEQVYNTWAVESNLVQITGLSQQAYHICWGQKGYDNLLAQGIPPDKLAVTGALHLDFCRKEMRSYYYSRDEIAKQFNLPEQKKWILYISSFAYTTMSENIQKEMESVCGSISAMKEISIRSKEIMLQWIEALLTENDQLIYIYRPHPAEKNDAILQGIMQKHTNFRVISDCSVKQWILVSDNIQTWFSTSVAEVFYMEKSCQIVRPLPMPPNLDYSFFVEAQAVKTLDDFKTSSLQPATKPFPVKRCFLDEYYDVQKISATKRVADFCEKVLVQPCHVSYLLTREQLNKFKKLHKYDLLGSATATLLDKINFHHFDWLPVSKAFKIKLKAYAKIHIGVSKRICNTRIRLEKIWRTLQ